MFLNPQITIKITDQASKKKLVRTYAETHEHSKIYAGMKFRLTLGTHFKSFNF